MLLVELLLLLMLPLGISIFGFRKFYKRSDMKKYERRFIDRYGYMPTQVIPLAFDKEDTDLLIHLCKRAVSKTFLKEHSPRVENHYIGFNTVKHPLFHAVVVRCSEKYAIISSGDDHCAYILKKMKHDKDTLKQMKVNTADTTKITFSLYAKFCYYRRPATATQMNTGTDVSERYFTNRYPLTRRNIPASKKEHYREKELDPNFNAGRTLQSKGRSVGVNAERRDEWKSSSERRVRSMNHSSKLGLKMEPRRPVPLRRTLLVSDNRRRLPMTDDTTYSTISYDKMHRLNEFRGPSDTVNNYYNGNRRSLPEFQSRKYHNRPLPDSDKVGK